MWDPDRAPPPLPPIHPEHAPERQRRAVPWRAREAIFVLLLAVGATALSVGVIASLVTGDLGDALVILVSEAMLGLAVVTWVGIRHRLPPTALGLRWPGRAGVWAGLGGGALGVVLAQFVVNPIVISLVERVKGAPVETPRQIDFARPGAVVLTITGISVIVIAPLVEEMFFRGFLYRGLRRWASPGGAAVISSVIFAGTHVIPLIMPAIFVLGLVLSRLVERRDSLVPSIVAHAAFNAVGFTVLVLTL